MRKHLGKQPKKQKSRTRTRHRRRATILEILQDLSRLENLATNYQAAQTLVKQRILRALFDNTLQITRTGYRTTHLNPLLYIKSKKINHLEIATPNKKGEPQMASPQGAPSRART